MVLLCVGVLQDAICAPRGDCNLSFSISFSAYLLDAICAPRGDCAKTQRVSCNITIAADFLYSEFAKKKTGCFPERKPPGKQPVFEVM